MTNSEHIYVYLVRRNITGTKLRCTDLIGKVGRGTGNRNNAYRTPYGNDNLQIDIWNCKTIEESQILEHLIHDLLEIRGWLRYHQSGKRAEVVSFPFKADTQSSMIKEYNKNMQWLFTVMQYYHSIMHTSLYREIISFISMIKPKFNKGIINIDDVSGIYGFNKTSTSDTLSYVYQDKIKIRRIGNTCYI